MIRSGSCQCQNVRFECDDDPHEIFVCHCTNCRKQSSSAFGISFVVASAGFRITRGEPRQYEWTSDAGNRRRGAFCGTCGTRLWHQLAAAGVDAVNIKAGTFDVPVDLSRATHIWVVSKLPGICIPDGARQFPREPG